MRLKDVCNVFLDGDWIENKDQSPAGIRLIQTGNIGNGIFLEKKERARFISEETFARLKCNEIFPGDILVSRLPDPIGRACIIPDTDERMITAVDCTICRVDKSMILPEFLCYFMRSAMYCNAIMENVTGTTRKRISRKNLGNVNVRLFPLDDQQAIVHKLDYITKIIKLRKKELAQLDYLIKARFVELFGDPVLNDKKFLTVLGDSFFKLSNGKAVSEKKRYKAGIPAYGGNGISCFTDKPLIADDTLVVGRVGFQSGNVHYAEGPLWITDNAMYISKYDKDKFNLMFLCDLMQHIDFSRFQDAGDLKKITQKPFMNFRYILPSMALQQQFVDFKRQVDKSKAAVQKALDETQLLFDSLMQEYFG